MVERVEDGGPAFPVVASFLQREHRREPHRFTHDMTTAGGMSLRDYFAAKALPAVISATCAGQHDTKAASPGETTELAIARDAYRLADAMIRARSPSEPLNARTQGVEERR